MTILAAVQMTSHDIVTDNLSIVSTLIAQAAQQNAKLVVLPENFAVLGDTEAKIKAQEPLGRGIIQNFLAEQAKQHKIWIIGGTIPISSENPKQPYAACLVFDDQGKRVAHYNKMHLFDVTITKDKEEYRESATTKAGNEIVTLNSPAGKLGLSICYDIRFPELFRALFNSGAEIFTVPAAFTVPTGQAHWEVLLRSRAIENFCYVIGAGQTGTHSNGRETYGHSMIIDPWGKVLAVLPAGTGVITADISLDYLKQMRANIPVAEHQRVKIPPLVSSKR